jgi:hypothetical protein
MGLLSSSLLTANSDPHDVALGAEALLLKQMFAAAHVGGEGGGAGASLHADLFAEAMAEAVAKAGGLGLAKLLESPKPADSGPSHAGLKDVIPRADKSTGEL